MILDVSYRTDIIAFYYKWFLNRINSGFLYQKNPLFNTTVYKINLNPSVIDIIVFCSKDYTNVVNDYNNWHNLIESKYRTYYYYTITPYGYEIENTGDYNYQLNVFKRLSKNVGLNKIAWRYDPIFISDKYTKEYHITTFEKMCNELKGYSNKCVISFIHLYNKTKLNMPNIKDISIEEKQNMISILSNIAKQYNIEIHICGHGNTFEHIDNVFVDGCQNTKMFENIYNIEFMKNVKGNLRDGCNCIKGVSIGEYNTCLNNCKYCYATKNIDNAIENNKYHNIDSPFFIDKNIIDINEKNIIPMKQESIIKENNQLKLF